MSSTKTARVRFNLCSWEQGSCSYTGRRSRTPSCGSSAAFPRLPSPTKQCYAHRDAAVCWRWQHHLPEMTAILSEPCSSRAMRAASSMRSMPKPWCWNLDGSRAWTGMAVPYTCNSRTMETWPCNSGRNAAGLNATKRRPMSRNGTRQWCSAHGRELQLAGQRRTPFCGDAAARSRCPAAGLHTRGRSPT